MKLIPNLKIGSVRSMKREVVYAVDGNNVVITLVNMGG